MKLTRAEYNDTLRLMQQRQDSALGSVAAPAYLIAVETPGFGHRSFMDAPLLKSATDSAAARANRRRLDIARVYTRSFFDEYLLGIRSPLLHGAAQLDSVIHVRRW